MRKFNFALCVVGGALFVLHARAETPRFKFTVNRAVTVTPAPSAPEAAPAPPAMHIELRSAGEGISLKGLAAGSEPPVEESVTPPAPSAAELEDNVLLEFTAGWCGPCRQMKPIISRLQAEGLPVIQIDIEDEPELANQFKVDSIPAFVLVANGEEVERQVGSTTEASLRKLLAKLPDQDGSAEVASSECCQTNCVLSMCAAAPCEGAACLAASALAALCGIDVSDAAVADATANDSTETDAGVTCTGVACATSASQKSGHTGPAPAACAPAVVHSPGRVLRPAVPPPTRHRIYCTAPTLGSEACASAPATCAPPAPAMICAAPANCPAPVACAPASFTCGPLSFNCQAPASCGPANCSSTSCGPAPAAPAVVFGIQGSTCAPPAPCASWQCDSGVCFGIGCPSAGTSRAPATCSAIGRVQAHIVGLSCGTNCNSSSACNTTNCCNSTNACNTTNCCNSTSACNTQSACCDQSSQGLKIESLITRLLETTAQAAALQGCLESEERFAVERKEMFSALLAASVENAALVAAQKSRNEMLDAKAEFAEQLQEIREQILAERLAGAPAILETQHSQRPILRKVAATDDSQGHDENQNRDEDQSQDDDQQLNDLVRKLAAENAELKARLAEIQQQLSESTKVPAKRS